MSNTKTQDTHPAVGIFGAVEKVAIAALRLFEETAHGGWFCYATRKGDIIQDWPVLCSNVNPARLRDIQHLVSRLGEQQPLHETSRESERSEIPDKGRAVRGLKHIYAMWLDSNELTEAIILVVSVITGNMSEGQARIIARRNSNPFYVELREHLGIKEG
jgi:hypothetical protein